jgi:hypothetical protein
MSVHPTTPATQAAKRQMAKRELSEGEEDETAIGGASSSKAKDEQEDSDDSVERGRSKRHGGAKSAAHRSNTKNAKRRSASEPAKPFLKKSKGKASCMKCGKSEKDLRMPLPSRRQAHANSI